jgi:hypothetical protein
MPLARNQHDIVSGRLPDGFGNSRAPVADFECACRRTLPSLAADLGRIFGARIIVGDDDAYRRRARNLAHFRGRLPVSRSPPAPKPG